MTLEQAKEKIKTLQLAALRYVAETLITEIKPYVPDDTGALRKTMRVEDDGDAVNIVTGDESTPYAGQQYEGELYHNVVGGKPVKIIELRPPSDKKIRGTTHDEIYWRVYEWAKEHGKLDKLKAEWYARIMQDKNVMRRASDIFGNYFRRGA